MKILKFFRLMVFIITKNSKIMFLDINKPDRFIFYFFDNYT